MVAPDAVMNRCQNRRVPGARVAPLTQSTGGRFGGWAAYRLRGKQESTRLLAAASIPKPSSVPPDARAPPRRHDGTAMATWPLRGSWGLARRVDRLPANRPYKRHRAALRVIRAPPDWCEIEVRPQRARLRFSACDRRPARALARAAVAAVSHASARFSSTQSSVSAPASENKARLSATA